MEEAGETHHGGSHECARSMRIAFLPLDDRPVTRDAFLALAAIAGWEAVTPPRSMLGSRR
jgi:hypothetical protein